jgi:hypothetical protein
VVPDGVSSAVRGEREGWRRGAGAVPDHAAEERSMKARVSSIMLLVVFSVLGLILPTSEAGDHASPGRDVVLYELNEQARFTVDREGHWHRVATSGLEGKARRGTPLCPEGLVDHAEQLFKTLKKTVKDASRCTVVAFGNSDLDLGTLQGTIDGQAYVVVNSDRTNLTDAAELVVMSVRFSGTIEVTDLVIVTITNGTFIGIDPQSLCPGPAGCKFTGKFRQPFEVQHGAVYKKDSGDLVWVRANERALGDPTVRLEITFVDD